MGDYGYLKVKTSEVLDEWKRPVFNATASRLGPKGKVKAGELPAGWMPSIRFAEQWLTITKRATPIAVWKP